MAYKDFTLTDLRDQFKIENKVIDLFNENSISSITPSEFLTQQLKEAKDLPIKSEKARSEWVIQRLPKRLPRKSRGVVSKNTRFKQ